MDKSKYMQRLHDEIAVLMERPVSLGRAEEICVYADTICALGKMQGKHSRNDAAEFTEADARRWTEHMENDDGSKGPNWTLEQATAVANSIGVHVDPWIWFAALNMEYSDGFDVAQKYGLDRPEYYADLAKAFLFDKDGGGPEAKIAGYYHGIVEPRLDNA
nr:MAG TPA: hypothetical protein [Caudoviricetes sp.]